MSVMRRRLQACVGVKFQSQLGILGLYFLKKRVVDGQNN